MNNNTKKKTFFLVFLFCFGITNCTFEWVNGNGNTINCNNEWTPTSSPYCWNPVGYPTNSQILVPSGQNLTITVPLNYTGNTNGFETLYDSYLYGPTHAFPVDSFIVEENAILQINTFVSLIVSSDSKVNSGGSVLVTGKLAALDGKGDITIYGNITISAGNVQGSGELMIMNGGTLNLQMGAHYQENYLLRNTTIQQGATLLQSAGITHTGFWWANGPVNIDVYGNISLSGTFYDWEEAGFLNIQEGGYFRPTVDQMRGISLNNNGTVDISNLYYYYEPIFIIERYFNNFALMRNDKSVTLSLFTIAFFTNYGVVHAIDDLTITNDLTDINGTYVTDVSTITFEEGYITQYPIDYYGGLYGPNPFFQPNENRIKLNGTTFTGTGNFLISGPISVIENLFIHCYTQLELSIYSPTFYTQGNFTVAPAVVFEIFGGGNLFAIEPTKTIPPMDYFINVNGNLEINGITSNLILKIFQEGIVSTNNVNFFVASPIHNTTNPHFSNEIWGIFAISGNFTSEISFVLYSGGSLSLEGGSYLDMVGGAGLINCGGKTSFEGTYNGNYISCPFNEKELIERRKKMEEEQKRLIDSRLENLPSLLSSYDISL